MIVSQNTKFRKLSLVSNLIFEILGETNIAKKPICQTSHNIFLPRKGAGGVINYYIRDLIAALIRAQSSAEIHYNQILTYYI